MSKNTHLFSLESTIEYTGDQPQDFKTKLLSDFASFFHQKKLTPLSFSLRFKSRSQKSVTPPPKSSLIPQNWQHLKIHFLDGETISASYYSESETRNFAQLGCMKLNGKTNTLWKDFEKLAVNRGIWEVTLTYDKKIKPIDKTRKRLLSDMLKSYFNLTEDPFQLCSGTTGWKTKFQISHYLNQDPIIVP